jgi:hypothetical protein
LRVAQRRAPILTTPAYEAVAVAAAVFVHAEVFAVGDVRSGSGKRVAVAVGEGSGAVGVVHRYLETV